jgi:hypothetical protein
MEDWEASDKSTPAPLIPRDLIPEETEEVDTGEIPPPPPKGAFEEWQEQQKLAKNKGSEKAPDKDEFGEDIPPPPPWVDTNAPLAKGAPKPKTDKSTKQPTSITDEIKEGVKLKHVEHEEKPKMPEHHDAIKDAVEKRDLAKGAKALADFEVKKKEEEQKKADLKDVLDVKKFEEKKAKLHKVDVPDDSVKGAGKTQITELTPEEQAKKREELAARHEELDILKNEYRELVRQDIIPREQIPQFIHEAKKSVLSILREIGQEKSVLEPHRKLWNLLKDETLIQRFTQLVQNNEEFKSEAYQTALAGYKQKESEFKKGSYLELATSPHAQRVAKEKAQSELFNLKQKLDQPFKDEWGKVFIIA